MLLVGYTLTCTLRHSLTIVKSDTYDVESLIVPLRIVALLLRAA